MALIGSFSSCSFHQRHIVSLAPPSEEELSAHEIGHAQDMAENLVQEQLKTREDAEKTAGDFAKKVNDQKKTVSEEEAEKKVREILGLPSQEERKNKK